MNVFQVLGLVALGVIVASVAKTRPRPHVRRRTATRIRSIRNGRVA